MKMNLHYTWGGDDYRDGIEYDYEADVDEDDAREFLEGRLGKNACAAIDEYDLWDAMWDALSEDDDFKEFMKERREEDAEQEYQDGADMRDTEDSLSHWLNSGGW